MPRRRDPDLDAAILAAAVELLNERGVPALTVDAIADRAGTSRPAVYRRYDSLSELVVAALSEVASTATGTRTGDPQTDLASELTGFRDAVTRTQSMNVAGSVLLGQTPAEIRRVYRERIVAPRRARIRAILRDAVEGDRGPAEEDVDIAVTMCTGSWYAFALAGTAPPDDWPSRTATLVLRCLGVGPSSGGDGRAADAPVPPP